MSALLEAVYPTPAEQRDIFVSALRYAYARQGITANVLPGSDLYKRAETYAASVSIAIANNQISIEQSNPLTALGHDLEDLAAVFGVFKRPAAPAANTVIIGTTGGSVAIPSGFSASAPNGHIYQTVSTGVYSNGDHVQVIAVVGGSSTNQPSGTKLTWVSASIGSLNVQATVGALGLAGGTDEDNDTRLRERLLSRLAAPPIGGNWSSVLQWAEEASATVDAAFVYAAARGPSSYDVVVLKAGSDRRVPMVTIDAIKQYIESKMPGHADLIVDTVTQEKVDIVLAMRLPLPVSVGGAGTGWRDASPWPSEITTVTAYDVPTLTATVDSVASPYVGTTIGIWDPAADAPADQPEEPAGVMREYTILSVAGTSGAWQITVQDGFIVSPLGAYVSAGALNLTAYARALARRVAVLGPGEKTDIPEVLPRGTRQPTAEFYAPSNLTSILLAKITDAYPEILSLEYAARYAEGTTTALTSPTVPHTTADPPNSLTLERVALIRGA